MLGGRRDEPVRAAVDELRVEIAVNDKMLAQAHATGGRTLPDPEAASNRKGRFPLSPNYPVYEHHEVNGGLSVVTLREHGKMIGYWVVVAAPSLHYDTCLTATTDMWFIDEAHALGTVSDRGRRETASARRQATSSGWTRV